MRRASNRDSYDYPRRRWPRPWLLVRVLWRRLRGWLPVALISAVLIAWVTWCSHSGRVATWQGYQNGVCVAYMGMCWTHNNSLSELSFLEYPQPPTPIPLSSLTSGPAIGYGPGHIP